MKRSTRNRLFEEKQPLIDQVMNRRRSLIERYGLCKEDVRQELALEMLRALDVYDPARCPNLDAYLVQRMNYKLLQMLSPGKRYGIPNAPQKERVPGGIPGGYRVCQGGACQDEKAEKALPGDPAAAPLLAGEKGGCSLCQSGMTRPRLWIPPD